MQIKKRYTGTATREILPKAVDFAGAQGDHLATRIYFDIPKAYDGFLKTIKFDIYFGNEQGDQYAPIYKLTDDYFDIPIEISSYDLNAIPYRLEFRKNIEGAEGDDETIVEASVISYLSFAHMPDAEKATYMNSDFFSTVFNEVYSESEFLINPDTDRANIKFTAPAGKQYILPLEIPFLENGLVPRRFLDDHYVIDLFKIQDDTELETLDEADIGDFALNETTGDIFILTADELEGGWYRIHSPDPTYDTLTVKGKTVLEDDVKIEGDVLIDGGLTSEALDVEGNTVIGGDLHVEGSIDTVIDVHASNDLSSGRDVLVGENLDVGADVNIGGDLDVDGSGYIGGDLRVDGSINTVINVKAQNNIEATNDLVAGKDLDVGGTAQIDETLEVGGDTYLRSGLVVDGDTQIGTDLKKSDLSVKGNVDISDNLEVEGDIKTSLSEDKVIVTDSEGKLDVSDVSKSEVNSLTGIQGNVQSQLNTKEIWENKTDEWGYVPNDVRYPTEKLVKDTFDEVVEDIDGKLDTKYDKTGGTLNGDIIQVTDSILPHTIYGSQFDEGEYGIISPLTIYNSEGKPTLSIAYQKTPNEGNLLGLFSTYDDGKESTIFLPMSLRSDGEFEIIITDRDLKEYSDTVDARDSAQDSRMDGIDERIDDVDTRDDDQDTRMDGIDTTISTLDTIISGDIEDLEDSLSERMDGIDARDTAQDGRMDDMDTRMGDIDTRDSAQDTRMDGIDAVDTAQNLRMQGIDERIDGVDEVDEGQNTRLDAIELKDTAQDTRMGGIDTRIDGVDARDTAQESRMSAIEAKDTAQDTRLDAIETKNTTQDGRLSNIEGKDEEQDGRLEAIEEYDEGQDSRMDGIDLRDDGQDARISLIEAVDTAQDARMDDIDERIDGVDAKDTAQDTRMSAIEAKDTTQDGRLNSIESKNTAQDGRLDAIETKNEAQDGRLTAIEGVNTSQSSRLDDIEAVDVAQNARLNDIESKDTAQDGRLDGIDTRIDGLDARDDGQDTRISAIEAKDTAQDTRLTSIEGVNTTQNSRLSSVESKNTEQDGRLNDIEAKDTAQDGRLTSIESKDIAQDTLIGTKADDDAVVHLTGNESIGGIKTFTDGIKVGTTLSPKEAVINGTLNVEGDIVQQGESYITHAEEIETESDYITMRKGAVVGLTTGKTSGFKFEKYNGADDGELGIDSTGTVMVGKTGDLQPLLTRKNKEDMTDNQPIIWSSTNKRGETRALVANDIPALPTSKITGLDTTITGINTAISTKVTANNGITAGTKCKITYDAKGLVTGGADLSATDIPNLNASKITAGTLADARIPTTIARSAEVTAHTGRTDNPHEVTKAQVGLGAYPTSPADIGIPTAVQTALDGTVKKSGDTMTGRLYANASISIEQGREPVFIYKRTDRSYNSPWARYKWEQVRDKDNKNIGESLVTCVNANASHSSSAMAYREDGSQVKADLTVRAQSTGERFVTLPMQSSPGSTDAVNVNYVLDQVAGMVGYVDDEVGTHTGRTDNPHEVTKAQVGLGNVDNTSDANKPVSTATNTELAKKVAIAQGSVNASKFALTDASGNLNTFRTLTATDIPNLNASKITAGTLGVDRVPELAISKVTDLQNQLNNRVVKNTSITSGTKTKITYDAKGLVTKGEDLIADDIPALPASKITSGAFNTARIPTLAMSKVSGLETKFTGLDSSITALNTAVGTKVTANTDITGATKCKITYDAKGLVTGGADLSATDIPSLPASKITSGAFADARIPTTIARSAEVTAHTGRTDNPHEVTKAQVGLGAYPTSPADIGISTATQTALDGKVSKTGNEEIEGIKAFKDPIFNKSTQDIGVAGYNTRPINRLFDVNDTIMFDDIITKESNKATGRKVTLRNKDTSGTVFSNQRIEFLYEDGGYREYMVPQSGSWILYRTLNADGTGYSSTPMRATPGSTDVVNTKYVLDRVDEMALYVDDEVGTHANKTNNPHSVTKAQVGLGAYPTSPADIGISTAVQTALNALDKLITPLMPVVDCSELLTMYKGDTTLTETPIINATGCTSLESVFRGCTNLETVKYIHTPNVINTRYMFSNCTSLTAVPELDTSNVTSMINMFNGCSSLTSIPALDTSNVTNMSYMLRDCSSLTSVTFTGDVVPPYGTGMFYGTPIASGNGYIFVPDNLVQAYRTASGWSTHASVIYGHSDKENMVP